MRVGGSWPSYHYLVNFFLTFMQETSKQEHCFIPDEVEIERILQLPATQTNMRLCWQCSSTTPCIYGIMDSDKLSEIWPSSMWAGEQKQQS